MPHKLWKISARFSKRCGVQLGKTLGGGCINPPPLTGRGLRLVPVHAQVEPRKSLITIVPCLVDMSHIVNNNLTACVNCTSTYMCVFYRKFCTSIRCTGYPTAPTTRAKRSSSVSSPRRRTRRSTHALCSSATNWWALLLLSSFSDCIFSFDQVVKRDIFGELDHYDAISSTASLPIRLSGNLGPRFRAGKRMRPTPCRFTPDWARASRKKNGRIARHETKRLVCKLMILGQPVTSKAQKWPNPVFTNILAYDVSGAKFLFQCVPLGS